MLLASALRSRYFSVKISIREFSFTFLYFLIFFITGICHPSSQDAIFRIVAAVLHLGNIEFVKGMDDGTDSSQPKDDQSRYHLETAAELLM